MNNKKLQNILIILLLLFSNSIIGVCEPIIHNIIVNDGITQFEYNDKQCLLDGLFDLKIKELMWHPTHNDIIQADKIIDTTIKTRMTKYYDEKTYTYKPIEIVASDIEIIKTRIERAKFVVYLIVSNKGYEHLFSISYFDSKNDYKKKYPTISILVSISELWIKYKIDSYM